MKKSDKAIVASTLLSIHNNLSQTTYIGICAIRRWIQEDHSNNSKRLVINYLKKHLPPTHHGDYCWKIHKVKPRKKWLKKHIKKLLKDF